MGLKALGAAGAAMIGLASFVGAASAAPVSTTATHLALDGASVHQVQYGYGYGYGPGPYGGGPYGGGPYGYGRPAYGPPPGYYGRPAYGPPVVCRFRPTPYGPRRVCFRRY